MRINQRVRQGIYLGIVTAIDGHGYAFVKWDDGSKQWMAVVHLNAEPDICEHSVIPGMICEADGSVRLT